MFVHLCEGGGGGNLFKMRNKKIKNLMNNKSANVLLNSQFFLEMSHRELNKKENGER